MKPPQYYRDKYARARNKHDRINVVLEFATDHGLFNTGHERVDNCLEFFCSIQRDFGNEDVAVHWENKHALRHPETVE